MEGIINVAGTMMRTGTTTLCIQLVKALKTFGYDAAYIECNTQDYIWGVNQSYNGIDATERIDKLSYDGIDMYSNKYLKELTSGNGEYDYLVCDYGSMVTKDFNISQFSLSSDIRILTGGVKPNEINQLMSAMKSEKAGDIREPIYCLYQIPLDICEEIREDMGEAYDRTFFLPNMQDPFGEYPKLYAQPGNVINERVVSQPGFFFKLMQVGTKIQKSQGREKRKQSIRRIK